MEWCEIMKRLIHSVTKKDFEVQTFRAGGKGGQNQNKRDTGVRIIHKDSGAVGESREERSQLQNKKRAFERLLSSWKFKRWHSMKIREIIEGETLEEKVARQMRPENLLIEGWNSETRKWVKLD
jgi:protein subunit release factor B